MRQGQRLSAAAARRGVARALAEWGRLVKEVAAEEDRAVAVCPSKLCCAPQSCPGVLLRVLSSGSCTVSPSNAACCGCVSWLPDDERRVLRAGLARLQAASRVAIRRLLAAVLGAWAQAAAALVSIRGAVACFQTEQRLSSCRRAMEVRPPRTQMLLQGTPELLCSPGGGLCLC